MKVLQLGTRVGFNSILFLTDFSEPSEASVPFAAALAREFGAAVHALHVMTPESLTYMTPETIGPMLEAQEEVAQAGLRQLEAQLTGVRHDVAMVHETSVWPALERAVAAWEADLIVLGTHGRTGAQKMLMGSTAEEIFRRARVPVLTIGPGVPRAVHSGARFRRVLFATDFNQPSIVAAAHAMSLAQEHEGRLTLLHVLPEPQRGRQARPNETSVADAIHRLSALVPEESETWCRPETLVEFGDPAERILHVAADRKIDLIVLGLRDSEGHLGAATHLGRATAHKVVAHATCPVLTVRT